jgi:hypothetical protein
MTRGCQYLEVKMAANIDALSAWPPTFENNNNLPNTE